MFGRFFRNHLTIHRSLPALVLFLAIALLSGCASYGGDNLKPGQDGIAAVKRIMGEPAMRWQDIDGSMQLAYPRGPMGVHSYMVFIATDGKLQRIENVMKPLSFAGIRADMSKTQVLRALGPPEPAWTVYFKARDELVWEWRYCDDWNEPARFDVLFDGHTETVRSTMSLRESQMGLCGVDGGCTCSR